MTAKLTLSANGKFSFPGDFATQAIAILARRRVGKTYTASVIAEEMAAAKMPFVVLDPTGAWWGLRSHYPVVIIGGAHGDVPLEPAAGRVIADLVVEHPGFYIIDLSQTASVAEQDRFACDFAERLYRAKERDRFPLHIFVDEADSFAPQKTIKNGFQERMLGAYEAIVRRGGIRGLGITLITQRPAVLNKNVLTQCECLIVLQITAPQDQDAIDDWVSRNGTREQRDELIASLASLGRGEAWVWSPSWLQTFEKIRVRERRTFNSSATPAAGEALAPVALAPVDLAKLGKEIAATAERAKQNDPAALHREIAKLKAELARKPAAAAPAPKPIVKTITVAAPADKRKFRELRTRLGNIGGNTEAIGKSLQAQIDLLGRVRKEIAMASAVVGAELAAAERTAAEIGPGFLARPAEPARVAAAAAPLAQGGGKRRMLVALAQYPAGLTARRLSILSRVATNGGTWRVYLNALRGDGLIEISPSGEISITAAGLAALGEFPPLPDKAALLDHYRASLGTGGKRRIFDCVVAAYPAAISAAEVSEAARVATNGGTWRVYVNQLRGLELITVDRAGMMRAAEELFQ